MTTNGNPDEAETPRTPKQPGFTFNPFEMAFAGHSNSGKTTLITRLIESFSTTRRVGYVKHDAHRFNMDQPGKDTHRAAASGADRVFISNEDRAAHLFAGAIDSYQRPRLMLDMDLVFVEGYKATAISKIVVIDEGEEIIEGVHDRSITGIAAFAGQTAQPPASLRNRREPYFNRDDIDGIRGFIDVEFGRLTERRGLTGLVLTGGHSMRMQRDKATLLFEGKTQVERAYELLARFCTPVYVSNRKEQEVDAGQIGRRQIHDVFLGFGPMGGILSAMSTLPAMAWLVLACDLPLVDEATVAHLLKHRNPFRMATAYSSVNDGFPEPLCAVYEPKAVFQLLHFLGLGYRCPRKVLINSPIELLAQPNETALLNVNHPEEYEQAKRLLAGTAAE